MSLRSAIPWRAGLHQRPPLLHRLTSMLGQGVAIVNHHPTRGGESSIGEMGNFHPALTRLPEGCIPPVLDASASPHCSPHPSPARSSLLAPHRARPARTHPGISLTGSFHEPPAGLKYEAADIHMWAFLFDLRHTHSRSLLSGDGINPHRATPLEPATKASRRWILEFCEGSAILRQSTSLPRQNFIC